MKLYLPKAVSRVLNAPVLFSAGVLPRTPLGNYHTLLDLLVDWGECRRLPIFLPVHAFSVSMSAPFFKNMSTWQP